MNYEQFLRQPEGISGEVAALQIIKFVEYADDARMDYVNAAEVLCHLSEIHWSTYGILEDNIKHQVENWVCKYWMRESLDSTELILSVIACLGLEGALLFMNSKLQTVKNGRVRTQILSAVDEFGDTVENPYSGLG